MSVIGFIATHLALLGIGVMIGIYAGVELSAWLIAGHLKKSVAEGSLSAAEVMRFLTREEL